jgi:hypothetical protein
MSMVQGVVIWGAVAIASAAIAGILAGMKQRDYSFWMAWGFIFPPVLLVLLLLPRSTVPQRRRSLDEEDATET